MIAAQLIAYYFTELKDDQVKRVRLVFVIDTCVCVMCVKFVRGIMSRVGMTQRQPMRRSLDKRRSKSCTLRLTGIKTVSVCVDGV